MLFLAIQTKIHTTTYVILYNTVEFIFLRSTTTIFLLLYNHFISCTSRGEPIILCIMLSLPDYNRKVLKITAHFRNTLMNLPSGKDVNNNVNNE